MTRLAVGAVVLTLLLAIAGCNAPLGDEDGPTETGTVTPAPVPEASPTTGAETAYPPGVGPGGVTDAQRLVAAHDAVLANTSHTVRLSTTREDANGSVRTRYERVLRVAAPDRYHYTLTVRTGDGEKRLERWRAGEESLAAVTADGETTYRRLETAPPPTLVTRSELARILELAPSRLAGTASRNGTTLYRLEGGPSDVTGLSNVSYGAWVAPRGLLVSYTVTYDVTEGDRTGSVRVTATFDAVGETTVERPPWYDEAT